MCVYVYVSPTCVFTQVFTSIRNSVPMHVNVCTHTAQFQCSTQGQSSFLPFLCV